MFGSLLENCLDKACCLAETFGIFSTSDCEVLVVCLSAIPMEDKLLVVELSLISKFRTETPFAFARGGVSGAELIAPAPLT